MKLIIIIIISIALSACASSHSTQCDAYSQNQTSEASHS
jgi:hypothetical protein